jgi:hypothetical protein
LAVTRRRIRTHHADSNPRQKERRRTSRHERRDANDHLT